MFDFFAYFFIKIEQKLTTFHFYHTLLILYYVYRFDHYSNFIETKIIVFHVQINVLLKSSFRTELKIHVRTRVNANKLFHLTVHYTNKNASLT